MTCTKLSWETLSDYQDGSMPLLTRWRIARHIKSCPDCAHQLAELSELAEATRARFSEIALPDSLLTEVRAALPPSLIQKEVRKMIRRTQAQTAFTTVSALAAIGCLGFAVLTPILRPTPAIADVAQAMRSVTTVRWDRVREYTHTEPERWTESFRRERMRFAADLVRKAYRDDFSPNTYLVTLPEEGITIVNGSRGRKELKRTRQAFSKPDFLTMADTLTRQTSVPKNIKRSEEIIDGIRRIRFDIGAGATKKSKWTLWVDPKTNLPIRTREEEVLAKNAIMVTILENFVYNQPIPMGKLPEKSLSGPR